MKFISGHKEAEMQLKKWAVTRTPVVARFSFWKPGKPLQKNLQGLIKPLVHSILSALPGLIPTAFPQYWDPLSPSQLQKDQKVPYDAVLLAFNRLVDSEAGMRDHCLCLFIDSLDEFGDPEEHHAMLAERLHNWTDVNRDGLKVCILSREENSFLYQFSQQQRLRLHFLTEGISRR
jgi:hypothetical protein